jgi:hypothetical protein
MSLESNMKRCESCGEPLPLAAFAFAGASRAEICEFCVRKQNSRVGGADVAPKSGPVQKKDYRGVRGGPLLSGYVK